MEIDKSRFTKVIKAPHSGQEFEIMRVKMRDYMKEIGSLPVFTVKNVTEELSKFGDEVRKRAEEDPEFEAKSIRFFLSWGVVSPKVWFGKEEDCPANQIPLAHLAADADFIAAEIAEYSFEFRGLKEMTDFFRGSGTGDPGLDGPEVRKEAVGDTAEGDIVH